MTYAALHLSTPEFGMRAASLAEIIQDSIRSFRIDEICFQHAIDSHSIHVLLRRPRGRIHVPKARDEFQGFVADVSSIAQAVTAKVNSGDMGRHGFNILFK